MIQIINSILGRSDSDKGGEQDEDDGYEVCDEHGHDYREYEAQKITASARKRETPMSHWDGINTRAVPGRVIGVYSLNRKKIAPCRDCPKERTQYELIERRIIYEDDDETKTIGWGTYEDLEERYSG